MRASYTALRSAARRPAAAQVLGAQTIIAVDSLPERLAMAEKLGARPVDRGAQDPLEVIR